MRLRFAPSPTGSLHLGNARTALFNWLLARSSGGTFVLRVEDTDTGREAEGSEAGIFRDLRWLGLDWDEGPDVGGDYGPYRQSERGAAYRAAMEALLNSGRAYRDFSTEQELAAERDAARTTTPAALRARRRLSEREESARLSRAEPHVIRFVTAEDGTTGDVVFTDRLRGEVRFPLEQLSDPVIVRSDGRPTYNFAVVVDDAAMNIDLVLRGDDHLSNTPRQVLMFQALGYDLPEFAHLPMVRGADGSRLSKRHGAVSVGEYARAGVPVEGLINMLALLGWSADGERTIFTRDELVELFSIEKVNRSASTFDPEKLDWISGQHIQQLSAAAIQPHVAERLVAAGLLTESEVANHASWLEQVSEFLKPALSRYEGVADRAESIFVAGGQPLEEDAEEVLRAEGASAVVDAMIELFGSAGPGDVEAWKQMKPQIKSQSGQKGKGLFQPMRVALTGRTHGPDLDGLVAIVIEGHEQLPGRVPSLVDRVTQTRAWMG